MVTVTHHFKNGIVKNDLKDVYVPSEIVRTIYAIVNEDRKEKERKND